MAHRNNDRAAVYGAAVGLLALGVALHYGWAMVPAEHAAQAWNICGAVARAALLIAVVSRIVHPFTAAVAVWWLVEESMVIGCSAFFIVNPWSVLPGQAQCSSLLGLDIGIFGGLAIMCLLASATVMVYRWQGGGNDEA